MADMADMAHALISSTQHGPIRCAKRIHTRHLSIAVRKCFVTKTGRKDRKLMETSPNRIAYFANEKRRTRQPRAQRQPPRCAPNSLKRGGLVALKDTIVQLKKMWKRCTSGKSYSTHSASDKFD